MILVTGARGNVGRCLIRQLVAGGTAVRALSRQADADDLPAGVETVAGDLMDDASLRAALRGVTGLFLFTPPSGPGAAARLAAEAGVARVVLLSSIATQKADPRTNAIAARHAAAEASVIASGLAWTILRPDSFAANALDWAPSIRAAGVVRAAYGGAQRCPIHEEDVAAVAALALRDPSQAGAAHWLTGPETITQIGQVEAIARAIGMPVVFEELPRAEARDIMCRKLPPPVVDRLLDYAAKSVHQPPPVSGTVPELLGRPARSFARWAVDHAAEFT